MKWPPNEEQRGIIEAVKTGKDTLIVAGAGTGKTSTLEMVARRMKDTRFLYIVYNTAARIDGEARMPRNVMVRTSHGLAYKSVGVTFKDRLNEPRMPSRKLAELMGCGPVRLEGAGEFPIVKLSGGQVASLVRGTVDRFCHSADEIVSRKHVPWPAGLSDGQKEQLIPVVGPLARKAWKDLKNPAGRFPFSHDVYLKLYQLGKPKLPYNAILLDEAQDTNPCVADIVLRQQGEAQIVLVGDPNQAIYEWRGAINAMEHFPHEHRRLLAGSYRFGPAIADEANLWLADLESDLRLRGYERLASEVTEKELESPTAVLCRGNAGVIGEAMAAVAAEKKVAIVGGGGPIAMLARAAASLMAGIATDHPDLMAFGDWEEVRTYVKEEREDAGSLAPLVKIVDQTGTDAILEMCERLVDEQSGTPDLVVSTAHRAKGREWDHVQIGPDFQAPVVRKDEQRLAYVAVTRAKLTLGLGSLVRSE